MSRLLVCLALFSSFSWSRETLPALVRKVQPAVATIHTYDRSGKELMQGSGFFIDRDGTMVTSRHVIAGADKVTVTTFDGKTFPIRGIVSEDKIADLAVIATGCERTRVLRVRDGAPEVGQHILVVGTPLGFDASVSDGIVSAMRNVPGFGMVLQMTAPISPGSSGSPVVDLKGEVIGVVRSQREEGQNLNFAVPGDKIRALSMP